MFVKITSFGFSFLVMFLFVNMAKSLKFKDCLFCLKIFFLNQLLLFHHKGLVNLELVLMIFWI